MKQFKLFPLIALIAVVVTACNATATTAAPPEVPQIKVGYSALTADPSVVWVAKESGHFTKNSFTAIELNLIPGGSRAAQALINSEIQFGIFSATAVIEANAAGGDLMMIASFDNALTYDFVVQPGIRKSEDVKGKRLGVSGASGSSVTATRYILREFFKLDIDKDITLVTIGNEEDRLAALQAKKIDGAVLDPVAAIRAKKAGLVILASLGSNGIPYQGSSLVVSRRFAEKNPQTARAFLRSMVEAISFYKDARNRDAVKKILGIYFQSNDAEYLENNYNKMVAQLQPLPYVADGGVKIILDESKKAKEKGLTLPDVINNALLKELEVSGFVAGLYK